MKKIFTWIGSSVETHEVAAGFFALFSVITTIIGIFRERLLATMVGPGPVLDAYVIGHKIPDLLYATTAAMVSVTILLPYIAREISDEAKKERFSEIATAYGLFSSGLSLLLVLAAPIVIPLIAPGASSETLQYAVMITRILMISPILMGLSNIFGAIAQSEKRFIATSMAPFVYNLLTLIAMFVLYPLFGPVGLAIAIVVAALGHMAVTYVAVYQGRYQPRVFTSISFARMRDLLVVAVPRTFSVSIGVISSIVVVYFLSRLDVGSLSLYNIALVIQNVPIVMVGSALAVSIFPDLVSAFNRSAQAEFSHIIIKTLRLMLLAGVPFFVLFQMLDSEIVTILFQGGKFTSKYTLETARMVSLFAWGILAQCIIQLTTRVFYARGQTWRPFRQGILGLLITVSILIVLQRYALIQISDVILALIAGWWVNAVVAMGTTLPGVLNHTQKVSLWRFALCTAVATIVATGVTRLVQVWIARPSVQYSVLFDTQTSLATIMITTIIGIVYIVVYFIALSVLHIDEIRDLKTFVVSRLRR